VVKRVLRSGVVLLAAALLLSACSNKTARVAPDQTRAIGVNGLLWRAALDTVSFLPLVEVDSASGAIVTDWYTNPDAPQERFKLTVFVLDEELRADAVRVSVLRQEKQAGIWVNAPVQARVGLQIEDAILTRARQIRLASYE